MLYQCTMPDWISAAFSNEAIRFVQGELRNGLTQMKNSESFGLSRVKSAQSESLSVGGYVPNSHVFARLERCRKFIRLGS